MSDGYVLIPTNNPITITLPSSATGTFGTGQGYLTYPVSSNYGWYIPTLIPATEKELPKEKSQGCHCKKCKDFNEFAEVNQEDGTFLCYACRKGLK